MPITTEKIDTILKNKGLSRYKASKLINYPENNFNQIMRNERSFPDQVIEKLLPILEISKEEFESWIITDKYPKEILERAIQIKKDFPYKRKSILTVNIDKIIEEKEMSRTDLAKLIKYNQSSLNQIITGKRTMSKSVLEKLSQAFEISQNEILSWIVADNYSLDVLERALSV